MLYWIFPASVDESHHDVAIAQQIVEAMTCEGKVHAYMARFLSTVVDSVRSHPLLVGTIRCDLGNKP